MSYSIHTQEFLHGFFFFFFYFDFLYLAIFIFIEPIDRLGHQRPTVPVAVVAILANIRRVLGSIYCALLVLTAVATAAAVDV